MRGCFGSLSRLLGAAPPTQAPALLRKKRNLNIPRGQGGTRSGVGGVVATWASMMPNHT
jgi:hypothetical protein